MSPDTRNCKDITLPASSPRPSTVGGRGGEKNAYAT
jgi:hypothetical protein